MDQLVRSTNLRPTKGEIFNGLVTEIYDYTKLTSTLFKNFAYSFGNIDDEQSVIHADIDGEKIAFYMQPLNIPIETGGHGGIPLLIHLQTLPDITSQ